MNIDSINGVNLYNSNFFSKKENEDGKMDELVHLIFNFLQDEDLRNIRLTCKRFQKITDKSFFLDFANLKFLRQKYEQVQAEYEQARKEYDDLEDESDTSKKAEKCHEIEQKVKDLIVQINSLPYSIKLKESEIEKKKFNRKIMDLFGGKKEFEKLPVLEIEEGKSFCMSAPIMRVKYKHEQTEEKHFTLRVDYKHRAWYACSSLFRVDDLGLKGSLAIFKARSRSASHQEILAMYNFPAYVALLRTNQVKDYYEKLKSLIADRENGLVIIK